MRLKNYNKQSTVFVGILTSIVLIVLIFFTFIAKRLYVSDSKKLLTETYINSIYGVQDKTISNFNFSVNLLNKFSNQITKTTEFKELYSDKDSNTSISSYMNYINYYTSLTNSKYIGIYDKHSNSFLFSELSGMNSLVLNDAISAYNNGSSFYCNEYDNTEFVTYTTNTYNGFITVYVLSQNFFDEIYSGTEKYPFYLFWQNTPVYSFNTESFDCDINSISSRFKSKRTESGYIWVDDILYICKKSANYSVISAIPKYLMNDYFSSTLSNISKILYVLLFISILLSVIFFCFSERIFQIHSRNSTFDTKRLITLALNHAFTGEFLTDEDIKALKKNYSDYKYIKAIVFQLDNFSTMQRENTPSDISHTLLMIKSACLEKSAEYSPIVARLHQDCIGLILASHTPIKSYVKILNEIQKYADNALNMTLTCTIGELSDNESIVDLCKRVYIQKEQRFFNGQNSIINADDSPKENEPPYPSDVENNIISALDANKFDECYNYIEQFIKLIHNCNASMARAYITQLAFSIVKSSEYIKKNNNINFEFIHKMTECETIDKCINLIATIVPIFESPQKGTEISFLQLILNMIEKEYSNPDFDLNMIAEQLNLTPHYVGHKFQKLFGKTFSSHLAEFRINKSKKLLLETDWKISYIATKCGFSSSSYFIRIFKKYNMLSPSAYRELYK